MDSIPSFLASTCYFRLLGEGFMSGLYNGPPPLGYLRQNGYAVKDPELFSARQESWGLMATGTKSL